MPISTIGQNGLTVPLTTSGSLGIGTASPTSPLQVNTAGVNTTVQINSTDANGGYGAVLALNNTGTGGRQYAIYSTSNADGEVGGGKFKFYDVTASTTRMLIASSGTISYGTSNAPSNALFRGYGNASAIFDFGPQISGSAFVVFNTGGTGVYLTSGNTSWTGVSDERLKTDLKPIENALNKVNQLRSVTGRFKTDAEGTSRSFLIAQDVQAVLPEAVDATDPEKLGVQYTEVIPLLVASIKELKALVDAQATEIAELKAKVA